MDLVIQSEFYKEFLAETPKGRDVDADAEIDGEARPMPGINVGYLPQEPQLDESKDEVARLIDKRTPLIRRWEPR